MKYKFFSFITLSVLVLGIGVVVMAASSQKFALIGSIQLPNAWSGSAARSVSFFSWSSIGNADMLAYMDDERYLHGSFWIETVGWASFSGARMECPEEVFTHQLETPCPVSGEAWAQNAGKIDLNPSGMGVSGSGVYFNPNTAGLEGFGWNSGIGWVPIFTNIEYDATQADPSRPITRADVPPWVRGSGIGFNFIGRVAVIGNIAGSKIFTFVNASNISVQNPGVPYITIGHADIFNSLKKNIALLLRNAPISLLESVEQAPEFVYHTKKDLCFTHDTSAQNCGKQEAVQVVSQNTLSQSLAKTFIVVGRDIIIDGDFGNTQINTQSVNPPNMRALIALKDDQGRWGNIIITDAARQIYAYLIAEGSVYSARKDTNHVIDFYVKTRDDVLKIPTNQLYINGVLISKNTIGGASQALKESGFQCPLLTSACTGNTVHHYDIGYFRNYVEHAEWQNSALPTSRADIAPDIAGATVIIDYNTHILTNPPPGLENMSL